MSKGLGYRIDPDKADQIQTSVFDEGFKNADIRLTDGQLLTNIQAVQKRQNLPLSQMLYLKKLALQQNLWVNSGSGKAPSA